MAQMPTTSPPSWKTATITEVNVFWVPEAARWENLRAQAKQADIGKRIDDALVLIEGETPSSRAFSINATPARSCRMASWASWSI